MSVTDFIFDPVTKKISPMTSEIVLKGTMKLAFSYNRENDRIILYFHTKDGKTIEKYLEAQIIEDLMFPRNDEEFKGQIKEVKLRVTVELLEDL